MDQIWKRRFFIAIGLALLFFVFWQLHTGRYRFIETGEVTLYRVDRWTGEVVFIEGSHAYPVEPAVGLRSRFAP